MSKSKDSETFETIVALGFIALILFGLIYLVSAAIWSFPTVNGYIAENWWLLPIIIVSMVIKFTLYYLL